MWSDLHEIWYADTSCLHNLKNMSKSKPEVNSTCRRAVLDFGFIGRRSSDFDQIWCADANFDSALENLSKIEFFKIQDGGRKPA